MRRRILIAMIVSLMFTPVSKSFADEPTPKSSVNKEELLEKAILYTLDHQIEKALKDYYKEQHIVYSDARIVEIERYIPQSDSEYLTQVQVLKIKVEVKVPRATKPDHLFVITFKSEKSGAYSISELKRYPEP